jgi:hypothetical protein
VNEATDNLRSYSAARIITGLVRAEVLDAAEAKRDPELLNFACGRGANTPERRQVVSEVQGAFHAVYSGQVPAVKVVKVREVGGGLIGAAAVCMAGDSGADRQLTHEPYIVAIGRRDEYHGYVLRDLTTSAGRIVLRAVVEVVMQERPTACIVARVRIGNGPSHAIFDAEGFDRLPRDAFDPPTVQVIRRRLPTRPSPPALPLSAYVPPRPLILPKSSRYEHPLA